MINHGKDIRKSKSMLGEFMVSSGGQDQITLG